MKVVGLNPVEALGRDGRRFFCLTSHGLAGNTSVLAQIQDTLAHTLDIAQMRN